MILHNFFDQIGQQSRRDGAVAVVWVVTRTYCKTLKVRARTVVPPCPSPWRRAASVSRPAHHHPKPSQPQSQNSSFFEEGLGLPKVVKKVLKKVLNKVFSQESHE